MVIISGFRSLESIEGRMRYGETGCIGLCRLWIREPGLIRRWQEGTRSTSCGISCDKRGYTVSISLPLECYLDR